MTADSVNAFADIWAPGNRTPRLWDCRRATVRPARDTPGTSRLDIRHVQSEERYRSSLPRRCIGTQTVQTWREFSAKVERDQVSEIGSLQNKAAALAELLPLRNRHRPVRLDNQDSEDYGPMELRSLAKALAASPSSRSWRTHRMDDSGCRNDGAIVIAVWAVCRCRHEEICWQDGNWRAAADEDGHYCFAVALWANATKRAGIA
jgi:hypothetical protein